MKTYFKILAILMSIITMQPSYAVNTLQNPVYYLDYSVSGTGAEIRLNDIPILYKDEKGTTTSTKPIPEYIIDGKNVLTIKTFPLEEYGNQYKENASVEAKITVNERNGPLSASTVVLPLHVHPSTDKEHILSSNIEKAEYSQPSLIEFGDNEIVAARSVYIDSPYPRWAWQDGVSIEDNKENYDSLLKKYKEIHAALNNKDMDLVHQTYKAAAIEYALSYNYDDVQHGYRIMNAGGYINEEGWVLGDINMGLANMEFHFKIFANGKLAQLVDPDNEPSLILYLNFDDDMVSFQTFKFYKNEAGEWTLIR